jgi:hypothetical protein
VAVNELEILAPQGVPGERAGRERALQDEEIWRKSDTNIATS